MDLVEFADGAVGVESKLLAPGDELAEPAVTGLGAGQERGPLAEGEQPVLDRSGDLLGVSPDRLDTLLELATGSADAFFEGLGLGGGGGGERVQPGLDRRHLGGDQAIGPGVDGLDELGGVAGAGDEGLGTLRLLVDGLQGAKGEFEVDLLGLLAGAEVLEGSAGLIQSGDHGGAFDGGPLDDLAQLAGQLGKGPSIHDPRGEKDLVHDDLGSGRRPGRGGRGGG